MQRALLIGSQTSGLTGCNGDVALFRALLELYGFKSDNIDVRTEANATRQGILDGFARLRGVTQREDAVVVYYSGHGRRLPLPDWKARQDAGRQAFAQFIVPFDMDQTTIQDFRGVLAEELSEAQRTITDITPNVTTILDCCYSGLMSRDAALVPKADSRAYPIDGALERLDRLHGAGMLDSNPLAVRVVACDPLQSAYEGASRLEPRVSHGLLTEYLVATLRAVHGKSVSWSVIVGRIREAVSLHTDLQRPDVEGPSGRVPFALEEHVRTGQLPVVVRNDKLWVDAAELLGVAEGDQYALLGDEGEELALATVDAVIKGSARLRVTGLAGPRLPRSAVPRRTTKRWPVLINGSGPCADMVAAAIGESPRLVPAKHDDRPVAIVSLDHGLVVTDRFGLAVHRDRFSPDSSGAKRAVALVEQIGAGERLRTLPPATGSIRLGAEVALKFTSHEHGTQTERLLHGERLFIGDAVSVTVRNLSKRNLYFWLFDIDARGSITLATAASASGRPLAPAGMPGDTQVVGTRTGFPLTWSESLPTDSPRCETFVVVVADREQDLTGLARRGLRAYDHPLVPRSPLEEVLDEVSTGSRSWFGRWTEQSLHYDIHTIDFVLEPMARPAFQEPTFAIDERPHLSIRELAPRGDIAPPSTVAVRLAELRAVQDEAFAGADVRVDAMVITTSDGHTAEAKMFTRVLSRTASGASLSLDDRTLFSGAVRGFLDIAIWVSRAERKAPPLEELFAAHVNRPGATLALNAAGRVVATPPGALPVGTIVAIAELVRSGAALLSIASGSTGLYRASFMPFQSFGLGRHPSAGLRRASGIDFALLIDQP